MLWYQIYTVQQSKRVDFFFHSWLHIFWSLGDVIYLSAGTESSTIGASIGPPPVKLCDIININRLSEDVYFRKYVSNKSSLFLWVKMWNLLCMYLSILLIFWMKYQEKSNDIKSKVVFLTYLPPKNNKMQYFSELTSSPDYRWSSKDKQYTQVHAQQISDLNSNK